MEKQKIGKILSVFAENVMDVTNQVSDTVRTRSAERQKAREERLAEESGMFKRDGKVVISSIEGLKTWLNLSQADASTSLAEIMQTQQTVLQNVCSPVLLGMSLDTLLQSLYQSLENEPDEIKKKNIRNIYSCMIQNMFFFMDAKICFAVQKNKEEAMTLLQQAGDQLASNALKIAKMATGSPITIMNFLADDRSQSTFFSKLCAWVADKKEIEKKIKDYRRALDNMFESMDRYSGLIGPSILIQGMLAKYRVELVEMRKQELIRPILSTVKSRRKGLALRNFGETLTEAGGSITSTLLVKQNIATGVAGAVGSIVSGVGSFFDTEDQISEAGGIDNLIATFEYYNNQLKDKESDLTTLNEEKDNIETALSKLGLMQKKEKDNLGKKLDDTQKNITDISSEISQLTRQLGVFDEILPQLKSILKDVGEYEKSLKRIEDEFSLSGCDAEILKR